MPVCEPGFYNHFGVEVQIYKWFESNHIKAPYLNSISVNEYGLPIKKAKALRIKSFCHFNNFEKNECWRISIKRRHSCMLFMEEDKGET